MNMHNFFSKNKTPVWSFPLVVCKTEQYYINGQNSKLTQDRERPYFTCGSLRVIFTFHTKRTLLEIKIHIVFTPRKGDDYLTWGNK